MKRNLLLVIFVLWVVNGIAKDPVKEQVFTRIDSILGFLQKAPNRPGCALGIVRDGELIYSKGYGLANVNEKSPITSKTNFDLSGESQQFTAMSILLLEEQGKLRRSDDIRKYIPEFPQYDSVTVTIDNLLYQTSGVREWCDLYNIVATPKTSPTKEFVLKLITGQKGLNFKPGTYHMHSNSNYFLLGIIVERVSGKKFSDYVRENIFVPLGMNNTYFSEEVNIPEMATGYLLKSTVLYSFKNYHIAFCGEGGIVSNVEDLYKWDQNFYHNKLGKGRQELIDAMNTTGKLSSGEDTHYACGFCVFSSGGVQRVFHGGNFSGFTCQVVRFPEKKLSVICLSNLGNFDANEYCFAVAGLFIPNVGETPGGLGTLSHRYDGYYFNEKLGQCYAVRTDKDNLWIESSRFVQQDHRYLKYTMATPTGWEYTIAFYYAEDGGIFLVEKDDYRCNKFEKLQPDSMPECLGTYVCEELGGLECKVMEKEGQCYFVFHNDVAAAVVATFSDKCALSEWGGFVEFRQDKMGNVNGFLLSTYRAKRMLFTKIN